MYLPPYARPRAQCAPTPPNGEATNPWNPFNSRVEFDFAYYHFVEAQTSASLIDKALDIWAATVRGFGGDSPWANSTELYATIDAIQCSDVPWKVYKIRYHGPFPRGTPPRWMTQTYSMSCALGTHAYSSINNSKLLISRTQLISLPIDNTMVTSNEHGRILCRLTGHGNRR